MLKMLLDKNYPLDEVMFYDTGMEFQAVYHVRDKMLPLLKERNIPYTELKPKNPFLYDMLERPVKSRKGEEFNHCGYGWCGGPCRWSTRWKLDAMDKYAKERNAIVYIGLAADEPERVARMEDYKTAPLAEWGVTEKEALQYCWDNGINWLENGIDLYTILDRVSCWCCANKNQKELRNIYKFLPDYWNNLLDLQKKIGKPMKKFRMDPVFGDLGNILNLDRYWKAEDELNEKGEHQMSIFDYLSA